MPRQFTPPPMSSVATLTTLAAEGAEDRGWYRTAHAQIIASARVLDVDPQWFAELLAVLSPRVPVRRNIRAALYTVRTGEPPADVLRGVRAQWAHWRDTGEMRGPKCRAFARALMGDPNAIVLDVWMGVALDVDSKRFGAKSTREAAEALIRQVSERLGWSPAETQAAIWSATYRRSGGTPPEFLIESELGH